MSKYFSCPECHKRTRCVAQDDDGERRFYLCGNCASRYTFNVLAGGVARDWPRPCPKQARRLVRSPP